MRLTMQVWLHCANTVPSFLFPPGCGRVTPPKTHTDTHAHTHTHSHTLTHTLTTHNHVQTHTPQTWGGAVEAAEKQFSRVQDRGGEGLMGGHLLLEALGWWEKQGSTEEGAMLSEGVAAESGITIELIGPVAGPTSCSYAVINQFKSFLVVSVRQRQWDLLSHGWPTRGPEPLNHRLPYIWLSYNDRDYSVFVI